MKDRDSRRSERAARVQIFGNDYAEDFVGFPKATELFDLLDPLISQLQPVRVGQLRTPVGKTVLMESLFEDFRDIARTARSISLEEPDFDPSAYRLPDSRNETPCITHAESLLTLLEDKSTDTPATKASKAALREKFLAYAIPTGFVEDLRADRDAIDECNTAKHEDNFEGVESTKAIDLILGDIQDIITRLDAFMKNLYRHAPEKLRAWQSAAHIERDPVRGKKPEKAPAPTA